MGFPGDGRCVFYRGDGIGGKDLDRIFGCGNGQTGHPRERHRGRRRRGGLLGGEPRVLLGLLDLQVRHRHGNENGVDFGEVTRGGARIRIRPHLLLQPASYHHADSDAERRHVNSGAERLRAGFGVDDGGRRRLKTDNAKQNLEKRLDV